MKLIFTWLGRLPVGGFAVSQKIRRNGVFILAAQLALLLKASTLRAEDAGSLAVPEGQMLSEAKVDSTGIFLDQIVVGTTHKTVVPHILLAPAPAASQVISFSKKQILELAQIKSSEFIATNWFGATHVNVSRRTRQFTDFELTEMLRAYLQKEFVKNRGELELRLAQPLSKTVVPDEPLRLKVLDLPSSGLSQNFLANCQLFCGTEQVGEWQVHALASIWRDVPVARSPVVRGSLLKDADLATERRDVLSHRDYYLNYPNADESLEVTDGLQPGMALLARQVRVRPVLQRGRVVDGVYKDGMLSISLKVETLEDGSPGQIVRVRNPKTRRELYGKVENEETVLISL